MEAKIQMNNDRLKRESMPLEEATISNKWEMVVVVEVLERKGLCTEEEKRGHSTLPPVTAGV